MVRRGVESLWFELLVMSLVLLYTLLLSIDLALSPASPSELEWERKLDDVELGFLSAFLLELALRLACSGLSFLRSFINALDALVIVSSLLLLALRDVCHTCAVFQVVRLVRLVRFAVIINKLQSAREAAAVRRKASRTTRILGGGERRTGGRRDQVGRSGERGRPTG